MIRRTFLVGATAMVVAFAYPQRMATVAPRAGSAASPRLMFEGNAGQAPALYDVLLRSASLDAAFHRAGVELALKDDEDKSSAAGIGLTFPGAAAVAPAVDGELTGRVNYLRGADPGGWTTGVPTFARVRYEQLYPGIDLVFYGADQHLEYDFVVAPHADPARIAMRFNATDPVRVTAEGDLVVTAHGRAMTQKRPVAYQEHAGDRRVVEAAYTVDADRVVRVRLGAYDRSAPLTIDPMIVLSRSLGGAAEDIVDRVKVVNGAVYLAGTTCSTNFPVVNALQPAMHGVNCDGFLTKMSGDGASVIYSTYFGGNNSDRIRGLSVAATGAVFVAGWTHSTDFPTTPGAFSRTLAGAPDSFVAKISSDGEALLYSTLVGGSANDLVYDLAVNAAGEALVTGETDSPDYPTTPGAIVGSINGLRDVLITKFAANGGNLVYSTYFGGSGYTEVGLGAAFDGTGNAWVVGQTDSVNWPVMGAFQPSLGNTFNPQIGDGFVVSLTPAGSLALSTYFGGDGSDIAFGVAVDPTGVYVTGGTQSSSLLGEPRVRDRVAMSQAAFVAQLAADGSRLMRTRLLDGHGPELAMPIVITRASGAPLINVAGWTGSNDFPTTVDALQKAPAPVAGGSLDLFFATLNLDSDGVLAAPSYATYLGGPGGELFASLASDGSDGMWLAVSSDGAFPTINWSAVPPGNLDARLVHLVPPARWTENVAGEVHLYAANATAVGSDWSLEADPSAANGRRAANVDRGVPKMPTAAPTPSSYVEWTFDADAGAYRIWLRGLAARNSYDNDSVHVQLSDSVDASGNPIWRIGSSSSAPVILEECIGCGVHRWGWSDNGYGAGVLGPLVRLATTGPHTLRLQAREDGLSIDQIVLSRSQYLATSPGLTKDDTLVLKRSRPPGGSCRVGEVVLYAAASTQTSAWNAIADSTAAGGSRLFNPDAAAPKLATAQAAPGRYFELQFNADAGIDYRLWIRGKALNNFWGNDSVFAQFSDSVTPANAATWRIGTTSATTVNLEECSGCGIEEWGWQDNGYGAGGAGPLVRFAASGSHRIRVQAREDGFSIDQIVLSSRTYKTASPGALKNDTTILTECARPPLQ
jgi:hypothetical protein